MMDRYWSAVQVLKKSPEATVEHLLLAAQGAADAEGGRQGRLVRSQDAQVQRGLHQTVELHAHGLDAVGQAGEHADCPL